MMSPPNCLLFTYIHIYVELKKKNCLHMLCYLYCCKGMELYQNDYFKNNYMKFDESMKLIKIIDLDSQCINFDELN